MYTVPYFTYMYMYMTFGHVHVYMYTVHAHNTVYTVHVQGQTHCSSFIYRTLPLKRPPVLIATINLD